MLRFKHFQGAGSQLERAVNDWLSEFEPDVTQMAQTVGPNGVTIISFVFEESFRGQELRLSSERNIAERAAVPAISADEMRDKPLHVESPAISPADNP